MLFLIIQSCIDKYTKGDVVLVDKESFMPYYLQIYNGLKAKIESGVYKPGEMLPSENQLVEEYGVTRATVRNAINKLKEEGKVHTLKGKGSYVNSPKIIQELNKIYTFGKQFYEAGYDIESEIIETYIEDCNEFIQNILQLNTKEAVIVIKLLRRLDGIPAVLQTMYLPTKISPDISSFDPNIESIYEFLERKYGVHVIKAKEYLEPIVADEYCSNILNVEINTPLFLTERITYAEGGSPVEYRKCVIRSDKVRFLVELY